MRRLLERLPRLRLRRPNPAAFPRRNRRSRGGSQIMLGVLGITLLLVMVWEKASVDRLLVRLEHEKALHRDLETKVQALSMQADRLSTLSQVQDRATRELGMRRPSRDEIIRLDFQGPRDGDQHFAVGSLVPEANAEPGPVRDRR